MPPGSSYEKMYINFSEYLRTTLADNAHLLRLGYIDHPLSIRYNKEKDFILMMNQLLIHLFKRISMLKYVR